MQVPNIREQLWLLLAGGTSNQPTRPAQAADIPVPSGDGDDSDLSTIPYDASEQASTIPYLDGDAASTVSYEDDHDSFDGTGVQLPIASGGVKLPIASGGTKRSASQIRGNAPSRSRSTRSEKPPSSTDVPRLPIDESDDDDFHTAEDDTEDEKEQNKWVAWKAELSDTFVGRSFHW